MKKYLFIICLISFLSLEACMKQESKVFHLRDLFSRVNRDSLIFDSLLGGYTDKYSNGSGSLYKFNRFGKLVFYCFLNEQQYPYAEYYNNKGDILKVEGKTSVAVIPTFIEDSLYRFSFLFSTFRKSNYRITTITNFNEKYINNLSVANNYSNVGFFNLIFRSQYDVINTCIINNVNYYDSVQNKFISFKDTFYLKDFTPN